jgi:4-hydroxybenzoate polyprenyltransferase
LDSVKRLLAIIRAMRPQQWVKNLLVFLPLILAHRLGDRADDGTALLWLNALAFIVFSLGASAGYVFNDLRDRQADRLHERKRHRPFASGALSSTTGVAMVVVLLAGALLLSWLTLPFSVLWLLVIYLVLSKLYTSLLKSLPVVDVLVLAGLYSIRILAGGAATDVEVSRFLIAFSGFLFLSLALLKRYAELLQVEKQHGLGAVGRGYRVSDLQIIIAVGPCAGIAAVLVMAMYLNDSPAANTLYGWPSLLWLACPVLLYWIMRTWLLAHRQQMTDDPVAFAVRDPISWACVGAVVVLAWLATILQPINL